MKILSCYSIKGGVGKTALAVNLACFLQARTLRVLLVDLDPQGAASFYFRVHQSGKFHGSKSSELAQSLASNIRETNFPGLDVIPSHLAYRKMDLWLGDMKKSRNQLRDILTALGGGYDAVVLDCPPNITLLAENIFRASNLILVPVIPTPLSVRTYEQLFAFFEHEELPRNRILPFFSMVQRRRLHEEVIAELRLRDAAFLSTIIPHASAVERMGITRRPLLAGRSKARAATAYNALCTEIWEQAALR